MLRNSYIPTVQKNRTLLPRCLNCPRAAAAVNRGELVIQTMQHNYEADVSGELYQVSDGIVFLICLHVGYNEC